MVTDESIKSVVDSLTVYNFGTALFATICFILNPDNEKPRKASKAADPTVVLSATVLLLPNCK
uniref:CSON013419 protein n=1 Tax=Culicoides sonorensis TaxID=179676 RepID=A0A336M7Y6_CULSO